MNENDKQWFNELLMLLDDARYLAAEVARTTDGWPFQALDLQDLIEKAHDKVKAARNELKK